MRQQRRNAALRVRLESGARFGNRARQDAAPDSRRTLRPHDCDGDCAILKRWTPRE
jgi:hypothetical protein